MPRLADRANDATTIPCSACERPVRIGEAVRWIFTYRLCWLLTGACKECQEAGRG